MNHEHFTYTSSFASLSPFASHSYIPSNDFSHNPATAICKKLCGPTTFPCTYTLIPRLAGIKRKRWANDNIAIRPAPLRAISPPSRTQPSQIQTKRWMTYLNLYVMPSKAKLCVHPRLCFHRQFSHRRAGALQTQSRQTRAFSINNVLIYRTSTVNA